MVVTQALLVLACQATTRTDDSAEEEHAETNWTGVESVPHHNKSPVEAKQSDSVELCLASFLWVTLNCSWTQTATMAQC